jgi:hypothetical protein
MVHIKAQLERLFIGENAGKETAMLTNKDIMLTVDYHDENLVVRRLCGTTGEEQVLKAW